MVRNLISKQTLALLENQRNQPLVFHKTTHPYNVYLLSAYYKAHHHTVIITCANLYTAQKYYDMLIQIIDPEVVLFYPVDQTLTHLMALGSPEFKRERIYTLTQLMSQKKCIVVTTVEGLQLGQLSKEDYLNASKELKVNLKYKRDDITQYFVYNGYNHTHTVEKPGDFSVRGSIIDFYSIQYEQPIRLDFFGDELEHIKMFDVFTQRSTQRIDSIKLLPLNELFYTESMRLKAEEKMQSWLDQEQLSHAEYQKISQDLQFLNKRTQSESLYPYLKLFNEKTSFLTDFIDSKALFFIDVAYMETNEINKQTDLETYVLTMGGTFILDILPKLSFEDIKIKATHILNTHAFDTEHSISLDILDLPEYKQNIPLVISDINATEAVTVYVHIGSKELKEVFVSMTKDKIKDKEVIYSEELLLGSFYDIKNKSIYIEETTIFNKKRTFKSSYRSVLNQTIKIRDIDELKVTDFVVHYDYGIGQYVGIKTMELGKKKRDYLHIVYALEESLYVPVDQIDRVLKFGNQEGLNPKLTKLGGKSWNITKASARAKIKDLSDRLIRLYASRNQSEGFAFEDQIELENNFSLDFPYNLTVDQARAIKETDQDMKLNKPMDRLICGDVGFGKTEVALRAVFKAVLNNKQVLVLVPTTVLARQHYYTFKQRLEKYGVHVGLLSRFVDKKEQKDTIEKLNNGMMDVVIGTHRVLSEDIKIKHLGLLIIDEEQRFGVEQKEKIRELKTNVDTLTLTATPIPRTLQMSMMGLKDVSMIETPPKNRYPVQTYLIERNDALIKEAIEREIARGGQVFYLFNRIDGMLGIVKKLQKLIPHAKIAYAHGKLPREQFEDVLVSFIDHEYDVLVSTTIIETGVDIPNTNTLIIHEAHKLGLSQLYQIRGRVGRSDRIAYAYMFYERFDLMNDEAKKRLTAIQDFTALGSGYKIALRDLSIRGAGDLLGQEQSGFIDTIGYELYAKLVEEAITGTQAFSDVDPKDNDVLAPRHIDPEYIPFDEIRIEIHKRISKLHRLSDVDELKEELIDRFGPIDSDLRLYMYEKLLKKLANKLGIIKYDYMQKEVKFTFAIEKTEEINTKAFIDLAKSYMDPVFLDFERGHITMKLKLRDENEHWIYRSCKLLESLI